jgi:hypothetical protein
MKASVWLHAIAIILLLLPVAGPIPLAAGAELTTPGQLAESVGLENLATQPDGTISATLVNRTGATLRDVRVEVDYAWVWANDFRPGEDSPGRTVYITAPSEIPPHGQAQFNYQPSPPLSSRGDGHFVPVVHIVGFTQIGG